MVHIWATGSGEGGVRVGEGLLDVFGMGVGLLDVL